MITRKWAKGNMITTFDQFDGQEYIWVHGKVYHHGWFKSWQYRYVSDLVKSGQVYEVVNAEYPSGITENEGKSYLETLQDFFEEQGIYTRRLDLSKEDDRNTSFVATLCPTEEKIIIK